jgi:hypothetical protein
MAETWFDLPYFYIFNGNNLVDGQSYEELTVPVQEDADFHLRAIHRISSVGRMTNLLDQNGRRVMRGVAVDPELAVLLPQEIVYEKGSQIRFSIQNVQRANNTYLDLTTKVYLAKIVFAGVKRFRGPVAEYLRELNYPSTMKKYRKQHFAEAFSFSVNWYANEGLVPPWGPPTPPRDFHFEFDNHTFEWQTVSWINANDGSAITSDDLIEVLPYDLSGRAMASEHAPLSAMNYLPGLEHAVFPIVPLAWMPQSMIHISVRSVMTDATVTLPLNVRMVMFGARRLPC